MKSSSLSLATSMKKNSILIHDSFIHENKSLSENHKELVSKLIGNKIQALEYFISRRLFVTVRNNKDFSFDLSPVEQSTEVIYQIFFLCTFQRTYLMVASTYNFYEELNREPYIETLGEYNYQKKLANALGFTSVSAYDKGETNHKVTRNAVISNDLELLCAGVDNLTFIVYLV